MEVMPDLYALPGFDRTDSGYQFNTNRAVPITVYICPSCGRFKFMSAMMLGNLEPLAVPAATVEDAGTASPMQSGQSAAANDAQV